MRINNETVKNEENKIIIAIYNLLVVMNYDEDKDDGQQNKKTSGYNKHIYIYIYTTTYTVNVKLNYYENQFIEKGKNC